MEPPSKDDPANPFGYKKVWGKQPQSAFRPAPPAPRPQVDPDAPISTRLPDGR
jgi:hypothetical protein